MQTDPSSDRVKREIAKYIQQTKPPVAERAANAQAAEAMGARLEDLKRRFGQARPLIKRNDSTAAQHLQRAKKILRSSRTANQGDRNRALTDKQRAWEAKKGSMAGADALIRDLNAFLHEYRFDLSRKVKDSLEEARNCLSWEKGD